MPGPFLNLPPGQRGAVVLERHVSALLADNPLGDPAERDLYVYLPPGYAESDAPLPALMFLSGFAGTGEKFFSRQLMDPSLASVFDHLIREGCPPFIGVFPDCMTRLGGSQYVDSPVIGAYASHLAREIPVFIEARYRTNQRWGALGHSSGGFGALHLAMNFPGAMHAVASHAGDMGFDLCYLGDIPRAIAGIQAAGGLAAFLARFWENPDPNGDAFAAFNLIAMSAAYATEPSADLGSLLPFDPVTGEVHFQVYQRWSAFDPIVQVKAIEKTHALSSLRLLYLDAGSRDEHGLHLGLRRFVSALRAAGLPHQHEEFPGGHRNLTRRYAVSVPRIASALTST